MFSKAGKLLVTGLYTLSICVGSGMAYLQGKTRSAKLFWETWAGAPWFPPGFSPPALPRIACLSSTSSTPTTVWSGSPLWRRTWNSSGCRCYFYFWVPSSSTICPAAWDFQADFDGWPGMGQVFSGMLGFDLSQQMRWSHFHQTGRDVFFFPATSHIPTPTNDDQMGIFIIRLDCDISSIFIISSPSFFPVLPVLPQIPLVI